MAYAIMLKGFYRVNHLKIITKKEAISQGLTKYYTGKPCKRGHYSLRYVKDYRCVQCQSETMATYYQDNRDDLRPKLNSYMAKWIQDPVNKQKVRNYVSQWQKDNLAMVNAKYARRRAKKLNQTPPMTQQELDMIVYLYYLAHIYSQVEGWDFCVDHIIPLDLGGLHHPSNLQVLETSLNQQKSNKPVSECTAQMLTGYRL